MNEWQSIFPYFGGKTQQLPDIYRVLRLHKNSFDVFVDVFGGSGKVALNLPKEWNKTIVYNDLDKGLYTLFTVLQDDEKRAKVQEKLDYAFRHYQIVRDLRSAYEQGKPMTDIEMSFNLLYRFHNTYLSAGRDMSRPFIETPSRPQIRLIIGKTLKEWTVENMDFKEVMETYNKPRVCIYLDPPYWTWNSKYSHGMTKDDFYSMAFKMKKFEGSYILNLSLYDEEIIKIFNQPQEVIDYINPGSFIDMNDHKKGMNKWQCGYWYKFNDNIRAPTDTKLSDFEKKEITLDGF